MMHVGLFGKAGVLQMVALALKMTGMDDKKKNKRGRPRVNPPEEVNADRHAKHKVLRISPDMWEKLRKEGAKFDRLPTQEARRAIRLYLEQLEREEADDK